MAPGFAVWITGLPGSGKSTIARALAGALADRGVDAAILESDVVRKVLSPHATYSDQDRDSFYRAFVYVGELLAAHGVPVIFDATANRRKYRERARAGIERFVEVYVDTPLDVCRARDPKGLYRLAQTGGVATLPGVQSGYEPPQAPDLTVSTERVSADAAAARIVVLLERRRFIASSAPRAARRATGGSS
jgi:adenylylsulfate kinase